MPERKLGSLRTIGAVEIIERLPTIGSLVPELMVPPDFFITALGFEERVPTIPQKFATHWTTNGDLMSIVGIYSTNGSDNELNRADLMQALNRFSKNIVEVDADSPGKVAKCITEWLLGAHKKLARPAKVIVDISGSSANFILSVMKTVIEQAPIVDLTIVYAEAGEYFPQRARWEADRAACVSQAYDFGDASSFVEFGVQDPEKNELYPGLFHESRPDFVIAIPSYRAQRLMRCLQSVGDHILANPKETIFWIFGRAPNHERAWRCELQSATVFRMLKEFSGTDINAEDDVFDSSTSRVCCTLDYRDILRCLIEVADKRLGHRISVVPMGSKFQSVGLALGIAVREEIGVTVARPAQFNPGSYSTKVGALHTLPLGPLDKLLETLRRIGQVKFEPMSGIVNPEAPSL